MRISQDGVGTTRSHAEDRADHSRRDEKQQHPATAATDALVQDTHKPLKSHKADLVAPSVDAPAEQPPSLPNVTVLLDTLRKRLEALNGPELPRI